MTPVLANMVTVRENGEEVLIDFVGPMLMSALYLFLLLIPIVLVILFFFYKKKLLHKQIMLGMDKGIPVSELFEISKKGPTWIQNIAAGVGLVLVAAAIAVFLYLDTKIDRQVVYIVPAVVGGVGLTRLLAGFLQNRCEKEDDISTIAKGDEQEI